MRLLLVTLVAMWISPVSGAEQECMCSADDAFALMTSSLDPDPWCADPDDPLCSPMQPNQPGQASIASAIRMFALSRELDLPEPSYRDFSWPAPLGGERPSFSARVERPPRG